MPSDPIVKITETGNFLRVYISSLKSSELQDNILEGPCRLYSLEVQGDTGVTDFLKLYDSILPVGGTTDPDYSIPVVSDPWIHVPIDPGGIAFDNGLSLGADDAGGTALGTDPVALNVSMVLRRDAS